MNIRRSLPLLAFFATLAGFSETPPAAKPVPPATKKIGTSRGSADRLAPADAELEKAIRSRFAASKIGADKFEVHVQGGRATLTGNTGVLQHKGTATRLARAAGAKDIENKIEPSEAAKEKAGANLAKGRRRAQIKRSETVQRSER